MKKHFSGILPISFCLAISITVLSACGNSPKNNAQTSSESQENSHEADGNSQYSPEFAKDMDDSAKAMAELSQKGTMNGLTYTSSDGKTQITLPDQSWSVSDDLGGYISFLSGNDSITISHFSGDLASPLLDSLPETQDEYEANMGNTAALAQVQSFEYSESPQGTPRQTKVILSKQDPSGSSQIEIIYTCYFNQEVYIVTALLESQEEDTVSNAAKAVYSFQVLQE